MTKRNIANLTAKQLVEDGNLNASLIGAQVFVTKGETVHCGTLQYFCSKEALATRGFGGQPPVPKSTVTFLFEGGQHMDFESNSDDVNIEILYPADV